METCKRCERCGAILMGSEQLGKVCNACLDRGAKRKLAAYKRATRRMLRQPQARRFKRAGR